MASHAISFALDSIAEWGKFPRFCVNTYRWGDQFFNGYDTTYVKGTGYKFNIKLKTDSWIDYYNFDLPNNMRMRMLSEPSTSAGFYLTYLAVSAGYDKNVSKLFGNSEEAREQYSFGFNCSLFAFNMYYYNNDVGTRISKFGPRGDTFDPDLEFHGLHSDAFGFDLYYFFDHKRYSQAAAFNFSRKQTQSHGSWFAGLSYKRQNYRFDFSDLPAYMLEAFPPAWNQSYYAKNRDYAVKVGYGYNWVFAPKWVLGVSESPTIGLRKGYFHSYNDEKQTIAISNQFKLSVVWNHNEWFAGLVGEMNLDLVYDKITTFENAFVQGTISVGYRFNIW